LQRLSPLTGGCSRACAPAQRVRVVIRIAVSASAYRAIKATLPAGSIVYPPERSGR
jgi:hypothetical protein